jgi:phytoene synthase
VANVYAYCRVTDDLVDRPGNASASALLDEWIGMSQDAYDGRETGITLLDCVMREMASHKIPFDYALDLAEGMKMDLRGERYANLAELRVYTYRVASVVGLWLTRLSGVHDKRVLDRAATLGHAMQLTNILRDVGEDARLGRVYLPADHMSRHGITADGLIASCSTGGPVSREYAALVEELLQVAERDYATAFRAIPELPKSFQRPVAVAAHVYRGIHAEIRRSAYDNLRRRAVTSTRNKAMLAVRALWDLRAISSAALVHTS